MTTKEPNELPDDFFAAQDFDEDAEEYAETHDEKDIEDDSKEGDDLEEENEEDAKEYYDDEIPVKDYGKYDDENAA